MLFWIPVMVLLLLLISVVITKSIKASIDTKPVLYLKKLNILHKINTILSIVIIVVLILSAIVITNNWCLSADKVRLQETQSALIYKAKSQNIRDKFGITNKDYIDEVQKWNSDIKMYKALENDFWIGIFVPNIYSEFETIDYSDVKFNNN